jgi:hypothetical protein
MYVYTPHVSWIKNQLQQVHKQLSTWKEIEGLLSLQIKNMFRMKVAYKINIT